MWSHRLEEFKWREYWYSKAALFATSCGSAPVKRDCHKITLLCIKVSRLKRNPKKRWTNLSSFVAGAILQQKTIKGDDLIFCFLNFESICRFDQSPLQPFTDQSSVQVRAESLNHWHLEHYVIRRTCIQASASTLENTPSHLLSNVQPKGPSTASACRWWRLFFEFWRSCSDFRTRCAECKAWLDEAALYLSKWKIDVIRAWATKEEVVSWLSSVLNAQWEQ